MNENMIYLSGSDAFVTENERDAYRVVSGTVLVFVAPIENGELGRRLLLCEVPEKKVIPSFVYRDKNYKRWRFILVAKESAELAHMPNSVTKALHRNFAKLAKLDAFEQEGFHDSIVEFYHTEKLKDNVYIERGEKKGKNINIAAYGVIRKAFSDQLEYSGGNHPVYKAVVFACKKMNLPVAEYDKVVGSVGKDLDVPGIARVSRIACRKVVLDPEWHINDCGVFVGKMEDRSVCCVPKGQSGYEVYFSDTEEVLPLTPEMAHTIDPTVFMLSRTLPAGKLSLRDLVEFTLKGFNRADFIAIAVLALITALIGVLLPNLNQKLYDEYIPLGRYSYLIQMCLIICTFMVGNLLFKIVQKLSENRLSSKANYDLQNAVYYRVFHLPENFFRSFDSGDLAQRVASAMTFSNTVINTTVILGISTLFSFVYLIRMFKYSAKLSWIALLVLAIYTVIQYLLITRTLKFEAKIEEDSGKAKSKLYQYLNGIEKLRMAGAEDQAVYEYLIPFAAVQMQEIKKNRLEAVITSLSGVISTIFSMVLYYVLVKSDNSISLGAFMGFNTAFGTFSASILEFVSGIINIYQLKPMYERFKPIIETPQEDEESSEVLRELSGAVDLEHITFTYDESGPNVLEDLNLHIKPGEYVGIVGPSGCGKSTLLKLLLGFEQPASGQVCYDGHDMRSLDKRELRKHLGVVLQNGRLIAGSIYENITITAPNATMRDVQAVVEAVGLKDDIAQMPMGLQTVLSENSGTISGGQQQRILIARAIISHPSILIFDEATSALDNLTQAAVCEELAKMEVTRIVVAHRLSTIKNCDRILVLQGGKVAEEGNYESLMAAGGLFYQLACRQID